MGTRRCNKSGRPQGHGVTRDSDLPSRNPHNDRKLKGNRLGCYTSWPGKPGTNRDRASETRKGAHGQLGRTAMTGATDKLGSCTQSKIFTRNQKGNTVENNSTFGLIDAKGFQVTFENGIMISVMFGAGNYCSNRSLRYGNPAPFEDYDHAGNNAEMAVIDADGEFIRPPDGMFPNDFGCDDVAGYLKPVHFAKLVAWIAEGAPGKQTSVFHQED